MKKMNIYKKILFILIIIICLFCMSGCWAIDLMKAFDFRQNENYFETEYFMCMGGDSIAIYGMTAAGKKVEELIIPREIDGVPVTSIGKFFGNTNYFYGEFTKIFIPEGVRMERPNLMAGSKAKIIFLSVIPYFKVRDLGGGGRRYVPTPYLEDYIDNDFSDVFPANVSYMYNCIIYPNEEEIQEYRERQEYYGYTSEYIERKVLEYKKEDVTPNEGYYWVDNVDISERIKTVPPEPTRDGYIFDGWFIEPECINEFDFENDTVLDKMIFLGTYEENNDEENENQENTEQENQEEEIEEKEDLILYAKWSEIE